MIGELCERPLAAPGFTSYRARSRYGWIMIGARNDQDALNEAKRTNPLIRVRDLQVWNGRRYVELHSMDRGASRPRCLQPACARPQAVRGVEVQS